MHLDQRSKRDTTVGGTIVEGNTPSPRGPHFRRRVLQRRIQVRRVRLEETVFILAGADPDGDHDPESGPHRVAVQSHEIQFGE